VTAAIVTSPALDPASRQVFSDMAQLVERYLAGATDDHREQLTQVTSLLRHASSFVAALSTALAEALEDRAAMWREADYYASEAHRLREENTGLLARIDELAAELAELKPQT